MSAIIILPVLIPAVPALWPVVAAAAAAAASAMGFAAAKSGGKVQAQAEVELCVQNAEAVTGEMAAGEALVFVREGVQASFARDAAGKLAVRVAGEGKSEAELRAIGQRMADGLVQQYAYHRLVTELKQRRFNVVDEDVDADGTVRLHVRVYQG